ncbi:MAG: DoxX family protein [Planctomycetales bacterium]|nr:DoxX family protein [Planctomycetales bacterium]
MWQRFRSVFHDLALLLVRVMVGVIFAYHGAQKLFGWFDGPGLPEFTAFLNQLAIPYPDIAAVLAASVEFAGGIALIAGVYARVMSIPLIVTMVVAIVYVHPGQFSIQRNGMEYPLLLAVTLAALGLSGPGLFSLGNVPLTRFVPAIRWPKRRVAQPAAENLATSAANAPAQPRVAPQRPQRAPAAATATPFSADAT